MIRTATTIAVILAAAAPAALAQAAPPAAAQAAPAAEPPACTAVVRAGRLIDPVAGKLRRAQAIRIGGDRVLAVLDDSPAALAGCARVIDLSSSTVLPGLIDSHVHLTSDPKVLRYERLGTSIPRLALIGAGNARRGEPGLQRLSLIHI